MWERDVLTILNFWADPPSKILEVLLEFSVLNLKVAKAFHCALYRDSLMCRAQCPLEWEALAKQCCCWRSSSVPTSLLALSTGSFRLQVLEGKLKECVPRESSWHEHLMEEIKRPQKLRSSAARENGSRPKGTCYEATCQACKWRQQWLKVMDGSFRWKPTNLFRSIYNAMEMGM